MSVFRRERAPSSLEGWRRQASLPHASVAHSPERGPVHPSAPPRTRTHRAVRTGDSPLSVFSRSSVASVFPADSGRSPKLGLSPQHRPHRSKEFTSDRGDRYLRWFAGLDQSPVAPLQAYARSVGHRHRPARLTLSPLHQRRTYPVRVVVVPRRLDHRTAHVPVPRLRDPATSRLRARAMFTRHQAHIRRQFPDVPEPAHVPRVRRAPSSQSPCRCPENSAVVRLARGSRRSLQPRRGPVTSARTCSSAISTAWRVAIKRHLGRRFSQRETPQPAPVLVGPGALAVANAMPEQELRESMLRPILVGHRIHPRPRQVPHRLLGHARLVDLRQQSCPQQLGQSLRVAAVRLDPVSRSLRYQRRRDHATVNALRL